MGLPHPGCNSPLGCRCAVIVCYRDNPDDIAVAEYIQRIGGTASAEKLAEFKSARIAACLKKNELERAASAKASAASDLEKSDPEGAVELYREAISLQLKQLRLPENAKEPWRWRDIPYLYNRLTLLLERLRRSADALKEVDDYETLPCQDSGTKSDREAILKRKLRLERKIKSD